MLCHSLQIPYFNAGIFLENKTQIGKVEEIFGSINNSVSGINFMLFWVVLHSVHGPVKHKRFDMHCLV